MINTIPPTEAFANVILGGVGMVLSGATGGLPQEMFALSGATQVKTACNDIVD